MLFSDAIGQIKEPNILIDVPEGWGQGRATFGGLVVAMVFQAMRLQAGEDKPVRNLAINFIGPIEPGPLSIGTDVLREGKAVSVVEGRGIQNGQVKVLVTGAFGSARESVINAEGAEIPYAKAPEDCQELPFIKGVTPDFTEHFLFQYAYGGLPFSGVRSREMGGWISYREAMPAITEAEILGLVDAWPPATLPWVDKPVPASTLTWTIQFVHPLPRIDVLEKCLYQAYVETAGDGYGYTHSKLWNSKGELITLSQQTVTVYA
ncbi:acyl-CoA thioesterase [Hahella ganghwensis]|uniref:acyl-CoA thioesterase n=1 Tax=Hahella ganghwensis TaxID=286420 RepID=UPI0003822EED|nr:thioesterase family protein [Hahella ganghwensis]